MKEHRLLIVSLCLTYIIALVLIPVCCSHNGIAFANHEFDSKNYCSGIEESNVDLDLIQTYGNSSNRYNFLNQYYRNLTYHGYNRKGSCGYVAIGMFLSFYDTYWNDKIIPDDYDKTVRISSTDYDGYGRSPGIYDPISSDSSVYNNDLKYKKYMLTQTATNFHAYLISIGNSLGYIGILPSGSYGLTLAQLYKVLNKYLESHPAANSENFSYTCVDHLLDYKT